MLSWQYVTAAALKRQGQWLKQYVMKKVERRKNKHACVEQLSY
jgi:hypothetical protein